MTRPTLRSVTRAVVTCERCPRLREHCRRVGIEKRAAFRDEPYWSRPVPGFGDRTARIVVVGLAPAAHGANRTGRMFTGDGSGGSGDVLMAALAANGLANQSFSRDRRDGLELSGAWITAAVRCAPPDNRPTPGEIAECRAHLRRELSALEHVRVLVALGRIAFDACLVLLAERGVPTRPRPPFAHGAVCRWGGAPALVASYHPSRQNTHTGRLTAAMLSDVFTTARRLAGLATSSSGDTRGSKVRSRPRRLP